MKKIFVIGHIGSGKSTCCELLAKYLPGKTEVVSLDKIGHDVLEEPTMMAILQQNFGEFDTREQLGQIVFGEGNTYASDMSSDERVKKLNQIMHPAIYLNLKRIIVGAETSGTNYLIVEETAVSGPDDKFLQLADFVVCCKSEIVRNDNPERKNYQLSIHELENLANDVINNTGDLKYLEEEVKQLAIKITNE